MRIPREARTRRPIRVFESVPAPGPIVKFIDEIVRYAPEDIEFSYFSWRVALLSPFDVFHAHWPEFLIRDRSPLRGFVKRMLFRLFLLRLRFGRAAVVRTVHNVEPHHPSTEPEARLLARLDSLARVHVVMSQDTPVSWRDRTVLIPHGDFRESFAGRRRSERVPGRVLLFGRIQAYKGVIELIRAAEEITTPGIEIRVVGSPTREMRAAIESELAKPNRHGAPVSVELREVSDDEMVAEMTEASLIALPYRDAGNGNSGVALLALSLNRPVLVPRTRLMERLAEETGPEWIQMMDSEISGAQIERALTKVRDLGLGAAPNLIGRDWETIAGSYAQVFRDAAGRPEPDAGIQPL